MKPANKYLWFLLGFFMMMAAVEPAFAALTDIQNNFTSQATSISNSLANYGIKVFSALILLQWWMDNWKMAFSGEFGNMLAKTTGSLIWVGFVGYMLRTYPDWINSIFNYFAEASPINLDPDYILMAGVTLAKNMNEAVISQGLGDLLRNLLPSIQLALCSMVVILCFAIAALSVLMVKIELAMVMAVAPVVVGLMGFKPLRDTGIAPFKSAMSLGIRALILGVICGVMQSSAEGWANDLQHMDKQFTQAFVIGASSLVFVGMVFMAGKIAAAIASGSAALDGSAGLMGALHTANTAGALAGAMGGLAGGMANLAKSMGEMSKNLAGGMGKAAGGAMGAMGDMMRGNGMKNASGASAMNSPAAHQMANDILGGMKDTPQGGGSDGGGFDAGQGGATGGSTQPSAGGEPSRYDQTADGRPASPTIPEAAQAAQSAPESTAQASQNSGNGSTASIGGTENTQQAGAPQQQLDAMQKQLQQMSEGKKKTTGDHAKDFLEQQAKSGDGHMVQAQVNAHVGGGD